MAASLTARVQNDLLDVDVRVDPSSGPVTVVFGPSGAGKTTLLRAVAGLAPRCSANRILWGNEVWEDAERHVRPRHRGVGMLFQDHALFPHLSVRDNVGYGLHDVARGQRDARVRAALGAAGAAHLLERHARGLSGGEAQRVALARALAPGPRLLLLDEPLSALDAPTRAALRNDLRSILRASGVPTLVVTHDRSEALALGDRMLVLTEGRVRQHGTVQEVFTAPGSPEVAAAVGMENVLQGHVELIADGLATVRVGGEQLLAAATDVSRGDDVLVCVRAEEIALEVGTDNRTRSSPRNRLVGVVAAVHDEGALTKVVLDVGFLLVAYVTAATRREFGLDPGAAVTAVVKVPAVHLVKRS